jgi:hypothetical protein
MVHAVFELAKDQLALDTGHSDLFETDSYILRIHVV